MAPPLLPYMGRPSIIDSVRGVLFVNRLFTGTSVLKASACEAVGVRPWGKCDPGVRRSH